MSLAFGRDQVSIPGPSIIPDRVLRAMHRPAPNIYEGDLIDLANNLYDDLNYVVRGSGDPVIYIGNGHAAWEASLTNTLKRGDRVLALETGRFTKGWVDMAEMLGIEIDSIDFGSVAAVDMDVLEERLKLDVSRTYKAILTVQTDTASSVSNDIAAIRRILDASDHPALLMVDCIASLGCEPFEMDKWGVDVVVAACQKGLMTPPGLAFVFIGPKAWDAYREADLQTAYWDWDRRVNGKIFHQKFCGTPPTHHLYGLREALDMIREEGIEQIWRRHEIFANMVWEAADAWGANGELECNVPRIEHRSLAVTSIKTKPTIAPDIRRWTESQAGLTLGVGLALDGVTSGPSDSMFRIGHMGHLSPPMLLGTLATVDAALKTLGVEHGSGAVEAATQALANWQRAG